MPALLQIGRVIAQDPSNHQVHVMFPSTQMSAIPVRVGFHGPADGVRVKHPPMPTRGTCGVVAFVGNDNRTAVWICSLYTQQMDALNGDDPNMDYHAHFSGYYSTLDGAGNMVQRFPDGTTVVVGSSPAPAAVTRHVVNAAQERTAIPFTDAERVATPPAEPFNVVLDHPNCHVSIAPDGGVIINSATSVTINAPVQINLGALSEALFRLVDERMIAIYNAHTHSTPDGESGPPDVPLSIGAETTTITFAG